MKVIYFILTLLTLTGASASNSNLFCVENRINGKPIMQASILPDGALNYFKFYNKALELKVPANVKMAAYGEVNQSSHSPYRGSVDYYLSKDIRLILPKSLNADDLEKSKIRDGGTENGALIIGAAVYDPKGHGSGNVAIRMKCISK